MRRRLNWFRKRGETLLEVVVAITIMVAVLTSVFTLLIQISAANINVINRVVGLNIAREGIEAVRNIRDTNWLKYSGDRRGKWLCLDTTTTPNACAGSLSSLISENVYRVEFSDADARYYLEEMDVAGTFTGKDTLPTEDFRLYEEAATGRTYHSVAGKVTPFYRQILLRPETTTLGGVCPGGGCVQDVRLNVVVRVQWKEGRKVRSLDLETYLYDFLGRDSY